MSEREIRKIAYGPGCLQALCDLAYARYPDECKREDNCEGQQFADKYPEDQVAAKLPPTVARWSIEFLGDAMDAKLREAFFTAALRSVKEATRLLYTDVLTRAERTAITAQIDKTSMERLSPSYRTSLKATYQTSDEIDAVRRR